MSPHDPDVLYLGGNRVFKLTQRGDAWEVISPDLTRSTTEQVTAEGSFAEQFGTLVSLTQSSLDAGTLWAGTDDGHVYITTDEGGTWTEVTPDKTEGIYVSKIAASAHDARTAYIACDGHRTDDFGVYVYMTEDGGRKWTAIGGNLPDGAPVKVIREDPVNRNVLYAGTERAAWVTIDRGQTWVKLNGESLPTVAVDDIAIQGREHDVVVGTHGRSVWILDDVSPLSQLSADVLAKPFHAFTPLAARPRYLMSAGPMWSDRMFIGENPELGANLHYWLDSWSDDEVMITITAFDDTVVRKLSGTQHPGINRVLWNLQPEEFLKLGDPHERTEFVAPGMYTVTIAVGDVAETVELEVLPVLD